MSLNHRLALMWRLRSPAASQRAAHGMFSALHSSVTRRHRGHEKATAGLEALAMAFTLERRAAELSILSDG